MELWPYKWVFGVVTSYNPTSTGPHFTPFTTGNRCPLCNATSWNRTWRFRAVSDVIRGKGLQGWTSIAEMQQKLPPSSSFSAEKQNLWWISSRVFLKATDMRFLRKALTWSVSICKTICMLWLWAPQLQECRSLRDNHRSIRTTTTNGWQRQSLKANGWKKKTPCCWDVHGT